MKTEKGRIAAESAWLLSMPIAACVLIGALEGPWWGIFAPLALLPVVRICKAASFPLFIAGNLLFGLTYYAFGFRGLLPVWGGAFATVWFAFTLAFASLHVLVFILIRPVVASHLRHRWWIFPLAFTAFEYSRHLIAMQYDGNGLTFLTTGQAFADFRYLRQIADVGGMWLLTSMVAAAGAILYDCCDATLPARQRVCELALFVVGALTALAYGWERSRMYHSDVAGTAIIVNTPLDTTVITQLNAVLEQDARDSRLSAVRDSSSSALRDPNVWRFIITPEFGVEWQDLEKPMEGYKRDSMRLQNAVLDTTRCEHTIAIVGAAFHSEAGSTRNRQLLLASGRVDMSSDKQHLVPFIEGQPPGTAFLKRHGMIPGFLAPMESAPPRPFERYALSHDGPILIPAICYDLFFSDMFCGYPWHDTTAIACSLDESFDVSGVFMALSVVHTRLRAVEFRCPVIRASIKGISGVMDGNGEWVAIADPRKPVCTIKFPFDGRHSLYAIYGDWWPRLCLVVIVCVLTSDVFKWRSQK